MKVSYLKKEDARGIGLVYFRNNEGHTALHIAVEKGHLSFVTLLLEKHANVLMRDNYKRTAIHLAAKNQHKKLLETLLSHCSGRRRKYVPPNQDSAYSYHFHPGGSDQDSVQPYGSGPVRFRRSVPFRYYDVVLDGEFTNEFCIPYSRWLAPDIPDQNGRTALHLATIESETDDIISTLLENGADVNARDSYEQTALHLAVKGNKTEAIVSCLLSGGADPNIKDAEGNTAVCYWTEKTDIKIILKIFAAGASIGGLVNERLETALQSAVRYNQEEVVAGLLGQFTDDKCHIVTKLLNHGLDDLSWQYPFSEGHAKRLKCFEDVARWLAATRARVDTEHDGQTALHKAATRDFPGIVEILVRGGADIEKPYSGYTPLCRAVAWSRPKVAKVLIEAEANPNAEYQGQSVLHLAVDETRRHETEFRSVAELLVRHGADINSRYENETVLARALTNGSWNGVRGLLDSGAVNRSSFNGSEIVPDGMTLDDYLERIDTPADISQQLREIVNGEGNGGHTG
ncbi:ankyrin repeat-containing domain protein [Xylaria grammica]|nr:ankyrin repeat-containing domain protein [Xylaria grammica]